jgi:hypothetical protein
MVSTVVLKPDNILLDSDMVPKIADLVCPEYLVMNWHG